MDAAWPPEDSLDVTCCSVVLDHLGGGLGGAGGSGDRAYLAPEALHGDGGDESCLRDPAIDIWSLGATLFSVGVGRPLGGSGAIRVQMAKGLWSFTDTEEALQGREKKRWNGLPEGLRDLIASCLRMAPGERPSARTLQVHPHFATIAALKASKELEARLSEAESRARKAEARAAAAEKKVAALEEEIRVVSPGGRSTGSGGGGGGARASP